MTKHEKIELKVRLATAKIQLSKMLADGDDRYLSDEQRDMLRVVDKELDESLKELQSTPL